MNHEKLFSGRDRHAAVFAVAALAIQPGDFWAQGLWQREESLHVRDLGARDSGLRGDVGDGSEHGADDDDRGRFVPGRAGTTR